MEPSVLVLAFEGLRGAEDGRGFFPRFHLPRKQADDSTMMWVLQRASIAFIIMHHDLVDSYLRVVY